ncbi:MAG: nucleotidyltransferase domain-containing protein [Lentimicrobiaceae bacterium]|nr:nucleotidyltransferase domain-containing protein [Lentimicrobiaceae bacterium]
MNGDIKKILANALSNEPVNRAWIFGSFSRGEETGNSDLDIMVQFSEEQKISLFYYLHLKNHLEHITKRKIDLVEEGQLKEFAKASVEKDLILIYERRVKG